MSWSAIAEIINKLFPSRKEAYTDELNTLLVEYAKALKEGRDTDAATYRKRMKVLRKKLGYTDGEV